MGLVPTIFKSKFLYILVSLLIYFIAIPFLTTNLLSGTILNIMFSTLIVVSINVTTSRRYLLVSSIFFGIISLISFAIMSVNDSFENINLLHYYVNVIFLSIITYSVIVSDETQTKVTPDTLFGAISVYLLIGLTWSYIYLIVQTYDQHAFSGHIIFSSQRDKLQNFIYYSFVTLTTCGYGDIVGTTNISRMFSWLESVTGQIYIAVWISQLVGLRIVSKEDKSR